MDGQVLGCQSKIELFVAIEYFFCPNYISSKLFLLQDKNLCLWLEYIPNGILTQVAIKTHYLTLFIAIPLLQGNYLPLNSLRFRLW